MKNHLETVIVGAMMSALIAFVLALLYVGQGCTPRIPIIIPGPGTSEIVIICPDAQSDDHVWLTKVHVDDTMRANGFVLPQWTTGCSCYDNNGRKLAVEGVKQ